jgi:hypothetical protein
MSAKKRTKPTHDEQQILEGCHLRLLTRPEDVARCDQAIVEHHYLHNATLVGRHLRYALVYQGRWLAVATWSAAALHLKDRDAFIGWSAEQRRRRLGLIANNSRLLVMPECHSPNLISRLMKLMLGRLSEDWEARWGHPIALVETFVDPRLYQGTAYKVSGWLHLGRTAGWKRCADDFYQKHDATKQIWVRELVSKACVKLRAAQIPPAWARVEEGVKARCTGKAPQIRSLMETVQGEVPEFRRPEARAYPISGLVCLIVMAVAQGVARGPQDLADYAATLGQGQLRALRFRGEGKNRRVRCPKKTTFVRVLHHVNDDALERALLRWQAQVLGPAQDRIVILDGKKIRHGGVEIVNATDSTGRFLGSVVTESKSNEIPAGRRLLEKLEVVGKIVLADALHTQHETARQILHEQGGDYLLTVKRNQPTLQKTLESLFLKQAFSPSAHGADPGPEAGAPLPPDRDPPARLRGSHPQPGRLSRSAPGRAAGDAGAAQQEMEPGSGLPFEQPDTRSTASPRDAQAQARLLGD